MKKILIEIASRFLSDKPQLFKYIQYISAIVAVVTGIPAFCAKYGIALPPNIQHLESTTVAIAAGVAAIISQLPNKDGNDNPPPPTDSILTK